MTALVLLVGCGRFDFARIESTDAATDVRPDVRPDVGIDGASAPWNLVQITGLMSTSLPIAASHAGDLIVVAVQTDNTTSVTSIADDAGNTYVDIPASHSIDVAGLDGLELWYAQDSRAGATTVTPTGPVIYTIVVWELSGIRSAASLDSATHLDNQAATLAPLGAAITTSAAGDLVISAAILVNGVTGVRTGNGFVDDISLNGDAWSHLATTNAPAGDYQAEWDQDVAGAYCASTAAFEIGP